MAARSCCRHHRHRSNMALSSGRLVTSKISPRAGKGAPDYWKTKLSWFREIHVPQAWRCLISDWTRFSRKKSCQFWVDWNPTLASISYLATLLWRKDDEDYFSPKLRVHIKDNNNSPHVKFHRFIFPFSSKFSDLNFISCVFCIYLCYVTCHTQWAWVTYGWVDQN